VDKLPLPVAGMVRGLCRARDAVSVNPAERAYDQRDAKLGPEIRLTAAASVGAILRVRPAVDVVVRLPDAAEGLWTPALSGHLTHARMAFTRPHYGKRWWWPCRSRTRNGLSRCLESRPANRLAVAVDADGCPRPATWRYCMSFGNIRPAAQGGKRTHRARRFAPALVVLALLTSVAAQSPFGAR
jgi:hypothetical protein